MTPEGAPLPLAFATLAAAAAKVAKASGNGAPSGVNDETVSGMNEWLSSVTMLLAKLDDATTLELCEAGCVRRGYEYCLEREYP